MERSQSGKPVYRKHEDGHLLQVLITCQFFFYIYKSYVLTCNSFYCVSVKCIHPEHVTAFHVDHLQYKIDLHNFLCFCSRTTVYSNLVSFEYSQHLEFALCTSFYHPTLHSILHLLVIPFYYYFLLYFQSIFFNYAVKICMNFCFILQTC